MASRSVIRKDIKKNAKKALRGRWAQSIVILFLVLIVVIGFTALHGGLNAAFGTQYASEGISYIGELSDLYAWFVSGIPYMIISACVTLAMFMLVAPIMLGVLAWYMDAARGNTCDVTTVFTFLGSGRAYLRSIATGARLVLRTVLAFIPSIICYVAYGVLRMMWFKIAVSNSVNVHFQYALTLNLLLACGLLLALFAVLFLMRYFCAPILVVRDHDHTISEALRTSKRVMKGHKWEAFLFTLSFFGWLLLLVPTLGVAALFVLPYMCMAFTMLGLHLCDPREAAAPERADSASFDTVSYPVMEGVPVGDSLVPDDSAFRRPEQPGHTPSDADTGDTRTLPDTISEAVREVELNVYRPDVAYVPSTYALPRDGGAADAPQPLRAPEQTEVILDDAEVYKNGGETI